MNEEKHIAIGKIGKAVKFANVNRATGEGDVATLYSAFAKMNPNYKFYIVGPNDLNKLSKDEYDFIFPNHNVFSVHKYNKNAENPFAEMIAEIKSKEMHFDFGLFFLGLHGEQNIPNFLRKEDGSKFKLLNAFERYGGPYFYFINEIDLPWYTIAEDIRYVTTHTKEILNYERMSFSQMERVIKSRKHIIDKDHIVLNYKDPTMWATHDVPLVYAHTDKTFMCGGVEDNWREEIDIDRKMNSKGNHVIVLSNGCGTNRINWAGNNSSRLPVYKKWIIDNFAGTEFEGTMIYGSWDKEIYDQEPHIVNKMIADLDDEIKNARYSLVYSQVPGFVTSKPWEMIILGLIPFLHPEYDCNHLLDLPEYVYCKDEKDFLNKCRELDADTEKYKSLLNECLDCIKPEYLDGSLMNNFIFSRIADDLGFKYEKVDKGVESIFSRFGKSFVQTDKYNAFLASRGK